MENWPLSFSPACHRCCLTPGSADIYCIDKNTDCLNNGEDRRHSCCEVFDRGWQEIKPYVRADDDHEANKGDLGHLVHTRLGLSQNKLRESHWKDMIYEHLG